MSWRRVVIVLMLSLAEAALIAPFIGLLVPSSLKSVSIGALGLVWLVLFGMGAQIQSGGCGGGSMSWRRVVIVLMLSLAEAALIAPLIGLLVPSSLKSVSIGALGLVWLILFGLAIQWQVLARFNLSLRAQRVLMGGWLIVLVIAAELEAFATAPSLAPDVLTMLPGFAAALLLWWRGMALGTSDLHPRVAELHLQVGLLILVVIGAATLFSQNTDVLIYVTAFFFGALTAIPLTNLELTDHSDIGRRVVMNRNWWGWVFVTISLVLLAGLLLTSVMTGRSVVSLLGLLLGVLLLPLILIVALIPESVFDWLADLIRRLASMLGNFTLPDQGNATPQPTDTAPTIPALPPAVSFGVALIVFAALIALVIFLMRRADRKAALPRGQGSDAEGALNKTIADETNATEGRFGLSQLRRWLATMTIRRLYVRAVHEATRRGYKRLSAQTPYDYLPTLQRAFPCAENEACVITSAYVAAHYGEVPDTREALDALKAAWDRMRMTKPTPDSRLPIA